MSSKRPKPKQRGLGYKPLPPNGSVQQKLGVLTRRFGITGPPADASYRLPDVPRDWRCENQLEFFSDLELTELETGGAS